jgi:hypothetical protein
MIHGMYLKSVTLTTLPSSQLTLTTLNDVFRSLAKFLVIPLHCKRLLKTFRMVVRSLEYVTPTTNDEANVATAVKCPVCERGFGNKKELSAHLAKRRRVSYCKGSVAAELANPTKRGDSVLDESLKQQKKAILAAGSEKIFYNGYSIENTLVQNA